MSELQNITHLNRKISKFPSVLCSFDKTETNPIYLNIYSTIMEYFKKIKEQASCGFVCLLKKNKFVNILKHYYADT